MNRLTSGLTAFLMSAVLVLLSATNTLGFARQDLVPENHDMLIRLPAAAAFIEKLEESAIGRLWRDETMQEFLGRPDLAQIPEFIFGEYFNDPETAGGMIVEEMKLFPEELLVAMSSDGDDDTLFVIAEMTEENFRTMRAMDERLDDMDHGKIVRTLYTFQGVDVLQHVRVSEGEEEKEWSAFVSGTLVLSTDQEWVERSVARLMEDAPEKAKPDVAMEISLRLDRILEALVEEELVEEDSATGLEPPSQQQCEPKVPPQVIFNALGLSRVGRMSVSLTFGEDVTSLRLATDVHEPRIGIWTLVDTKPADKNIRLPYVPQNAVSYSVTRLDLQSFWNHLPQMTASISPGAEGQFLGLVGMLQGAYALDFNTEIIAHLDTTLVTVGTAQEGKSASIMAWLLRDAEGLSATLARLLAEGSPLRVQAGQGLVVENLRGHSLFVVKGPVEEVFALGIVGPYLVIGNPEALRDIVLASSAGESRTETFYQAQLYRMLMERVPDEAFGYSVVDLASLIESFFTGLDKETFEGIKASILERDDKEEAEEGGAFESFVTGLSYENLPSPDRIASFFGLYLSHSIATPEGFELTFTLPRVEAAQKL